MLQNSDATKYLQVAIDTPLDQLFEYLLPAELATTNIGIGAKIIVPFGMGNRLVVAIVIAINDKPSFNVAKIKAVKKIIDPQTEITNFLIETIKWSSSYYQCSFNEFLLKCLPKKLRANQPKPVNKVVVWKYKADGQLKKSKQLDALELIKKYTTGIVATELSAAGFKPHTITALAQKQLIYKSHKIKIETKFYQVTNPCNPSPYNLSTQQLQIAKAINSYLDKFKVFLLDGVTGSGKTEVYLYAIQKTILAGKQVMVMIPEIGLVSQILARIKARFNIDIACWHSELNDKQRYESWCRCHAQTAGILITTRSGVFIPMPKLGLVIIDEEHDSSYKNQQKPFYNARDIAVWIASKVGCPVVLGSATPSLESYYNASFGKYQLYKLTQRTNFAVMPNCKIIDLCNQQLQGGIAITTIEIMQQHLLKGNQVIVLLNRRGYASALNCQDCGAIINCLYCDTAMILHKQPPHIKCHHCEYQSAIPTKCADCNSTNLRPVGFGTEKAEETLQKIFQCYDIIRVDRDTISKTNNMEQLSLKLQQNKPCIIVGTQMLAKGHHWPKITLVVILNIDSGIFNEDYRAGEITSQLITQAAGRAGRDRQQGMVIVQTYNPKHQIFNVLKNHNYSQHAQYLMADRQSRKLPPFTNMAIIRAEDKLNNKAVNFLTTIKQFANDIKQLIDASISIFGPLECNLLRKNELYRWIIIIVADRGPLHYFLIYLRKAISDKNIPTIMRWIIDVDPYETC